MLCAHRVRAGGQWKMRKQITLWAKRYWSDFCTIVEHDVPEDEFLDLVRVHSFVLCAECGGLDPSPKAWQSILNGAIPIIRETALRSVYSEFPVMFVPHWCGNAITFDQLEKYYAEHSVQYTSSHIPDEILYKLSLDYWWEQSIS